MIRLHLLEFVVLAAHRTDPVLTLIRSTRHPGRESPDTEMLLLPIYQILVDSLVAGHVIVFHQFYDTLLHLFGIVLVILIPVVVQAPVETLHFLPVVREQRLYPGNHALEVQPELVAVGIVLMSGHVVLDLAAIAVRDPFQGRLQVFLPDITLGVSNADDYAAIYNLVVHELAHASHFTRVGVDYWDRYIEYIISSFVRSGGVVYGTGTESDSGYCEIGEMWAYYLEQKLYSDRYGGNPPSFGQEWWFFPQIFRYLDERGMTPSEIIKALDEDVASREALKAKLVSLYPGRKAIIDEVFARYTNE